MSNNITVDVEPAKKVLNKYRTTPGRLQYASFQAARYLLGPIKAATPVRSGRLRDRTKAWAAKRGEIGAGVGPLAPHRHLVIRPHRIVTPGGRDTGRMTSGNPYIDATLETNKDGAWKVFTDTLFEEQP